MRNSQRYVLRATTATIALLVTLLLAPASRSVRAESELIVNGGFELGLGGWTRLDQLGSDGSFFPQSGTASPVNGFPVPAPPNGIAAAMTDAQGSGAHLLYQDFVVPTNNQFGTLTFSLFIGNRADRFVTPNTLDFSTAALNQQARVDILRPGADPFSVASTDVLQNAFQTRVGDTLVTPGYVNFTVDVSNLIRSQGGQTLTLRFAETDNVSFFNLGVDNVSLITVVPEPASLVLFGVGMTGLVVACTVARRHRRATALTD